ncbi:MAG: hypothetical protein U1D67_00355, partial [Dehalococcoidia bacterium]|nr:hypothetical protein [Dehalococcoidia bacterium]
MQSRTGLLFSVVIFIFVSLILSVFKPAAFANPVTLKLFTFLPDIPPENVPIHMFMDKVNQKAAGQLVVQYGGGPDAIAPQDLAGATQKGVVSLACHIMSLADAVVPGARVIIHNELPLKEFRARAQDYIQGMFNEAGLYYLGLSHAVEPQTFNNLFSIKKPITKPEDFAGLTMASPSPLAFPLYRALNANPVFIPLHNYFV